MGLYLGEVLPQLLRFLALIGASMYHLATPSLLREADLGSLFWDVAAVVDPNVPLCAVARDVSDVPSRAQVDAGSHPGFLPGFDSAIAGLYNGSARSGALRSSVRGRL